MPNYSLNGFDYTLEELEEKAKSLEMSVEDFIALKNIQVTPDNYVESLPEQQSTEDPLTQWNESLAKTFGSTEIAAPVEPQKTTQQDTELLLEDTSSELLEVDKPKPKKKEDLPQISLEDIGSNREQEEVAADNVNDWLKVNLPGDFTVEEPVNPFEESFVVKSNVTGKKFEYTISSVFDTSSGTIYGTPEAVKNAPISALNEFLYAESRHNKGNDQDFYKAANISIPEAKELVNNDEDFNKNLFILNRDSTLNQIYKNVSALLNTNEFSKYSIEQLNQDPVAREEYVEDLYDTLEDNNKLPLGSLDYFNSDGIEKIVDQSLTKALQEKEAKRKEDAIEAAVSYAETTGTPYEERVDLFSGITKNRYEESIKDNPVAKQLFDIAKKIRQINNDINNSSDVAQKAVLNKEKSELQKRRKKLSPDFVQISNLDTGKVAYVNPKNIDELNFSGVDITGITQAYTEIYSKKSVEGLKAEAADLGVDLVANDKLGDKILPYVKLNITKIGGGILPGGVSSSREEVVLTDVKVKDLYKYTKNGNIKEAVYDKDGNKINDEINQYFDERANLTAKTTAIGELVFLDKSTEKEDPGLFKSIKEGFIKSIDEDYATTRENIDLKTQILENAGVKFTKGMKDVRVSDLSEDLGFGIGSSVLPAAEFVVINVATSGLGSIVEATAFGSRILNGYKALKTSKNAWNRILWKTGQVALEEAKTQVIGMDTGSGAAFKAFHFAAPLQFRKYLTPSLENIGLGNKAANIVSNVSDIMAGSTIRAAGAMETAGVVEHVIKEGEISNYIDENFKSLDQVSKRMLVQGVSMAWMGGMELFKPQTYWGEVEFSKALERTNQEIRKSKNPQEIEKLKGARDIIISQLQYQKSSKDLANNKKARIILRDRVAESQKELQKAAESGEVDLEVTTTDLADSNNNGGFDFDFENDRLKLKVTINTGKVLTKGTTKNGVETAVISKPTTMGHEGFHATKALEAYRILKNRGEKGITKEKIIELKEQLVKAEATRALNAANKIKAVTGFDIENIRRSISKAYESDGKKLTESELNEEVLAYTRDQLYLNISNKTMSLLRLKKITNAIQSSLGIKGDLKSSNDFLEVLDRLSGKKSKPYLEKDVDISTEAVAATKIGASEVMNQKDIDLDAYNKLEKEKIDLELKLDAFEIEYDQYEQLLRNIELKQDKLSRDKAYSAKPVAKKQDTKQIGDAIKALIPEGLTKKEYDNKYVGNALTKLTETEMVDGVIRNMMARDAIVSDNVFGVSKQEFINEVKGKGKSNSFLKAIINFNPEKNDDFGGWVISSLRNRYKDALVLFKKQRSETQAKDVADVKGLAFESSESGFEEMDLSIRSKSETKVEVSEFDRPTFKERGIINETNESFVDDALFSALEKLSENVYSADKSINKRKTGLLADLLKALPNEKPSFKGFKKSINLKELVTGSNKDAVIENLSTFFLGGKTKGDKVLGGMPFAIEKRVDGEWLKYPDWVGKKIDRESMSEGQAGRTSGNELARRAPSSSVETLEPALAKRGSDLSLYKQMFNVSGSQRLVEILNKETPNSKEAKIQDLFNKISENSDISKELGVASYRESVFRMMEQKDIDWDVAEKLLKNADKIVDKLIIAYDDNKQKRISILKEYSPELKTNNAEQLLGTIDKSIRVTYKIQKNGRVKNVVNKIKNNESLKDNELETLKGVMKGALIEKTVSKIKTKSLVDSKGNLTKTGEKFRNHGKLFLNRNKKLTPKDLDFFLSTWGAPIRYNGNYYLSNAKLIEMFPELEKAGLQLEKKQSPKGSYLTYLTYKGKNIYDFRTARGKELMLDPVKRNDYNIKAKDYRRRLKKEIDLIENIEEKIEFINPLFSGLNTTGGLLSKAELIQVVNGKATTPGKAVWEHNSPREVTKAVYKRYALGYINGKELDAFVKNYSSNLISGEANTILESNGYRQKGSYIERLNILMENGIEFTTLDNVNPDLSLKNFKKIFNKKSSVLNQKDLNLEINEMIERASGIDAKETLSAVVARRMGNRKKSLKFFLPPGAEDFRGLYYTLAGKGEQGEADIKFFKDNLVLPYTRGIAKIDQSRQALLNDYKTLNKTFKKPLKETGVKKLNKNIPDADITIEQAIRIYLWDKGGFKIPELTEADKKKAVDYVYKNPAITAYADSLLAISKHENWSKPSEYWDAQSILTDLQDIALNINRKEYLKEFVENKDIIFSSDNLNKLEAAYGKSYREAMEDMLYRMENGSNRSFGQDSLVSKWNNWVNGSTGAIMFFNRRSATLQLLSTINFMNTSDNNPIKAAAAFANQPQYWKDWVKIFNSPKLKERRGGLKSDIQEAEIAAAARDSKNKPQAILSYILKKGFIPTQIADSFAIATGGASFYRNRIKTYEKQGFEKAEAEMKAWEDFSLISDETQQSGDPMLVSKQQASPIGRLILAFANTPAQITRFQKRDLQDLKNRRRIEGKNQFQSDATYVSRVLYYTAVQNFIFSALQQGLFTLIPGFDDDEDLTDEELEKRAKKEESKLPKILNGMLDTTLRGSGIYGAIASTGKNVILKYLEQQEETAFNKKNEAVVFEAVNISPPIGSKIRKFYNALNTQDYEKDVIDARGFDVMIDNKFQLSPSYQVLGGITSAVTNVPLDRVVSEVNAVTEAFDSRNTNFQRLALSMGWKEWEVGAEIEEHETVKTEAKKKRKQEGIEKRKKIAKEKRETEEKAIKNFSQKELNEYVDWKLKNKGKRLYDYLKEKNKL
jgi:hypothetical protein